MYALRLRVFVYLSPPEGDDSVREYSIFQFDLRFLVQFCCLPNRTKLGRGAIDKIFAQANKVNFALAAIQSLTNPNTIHSHDESVYSTCEW